MLWRPAATPGADGFFGNRSFPWELLRVIRCLRNERFGSNTTVEQAPREARTLVQAPHENRCLHYFCGPTRSLIGGTLVVSQVNARQPSCQPSSIVASMDWWL